MTYRQQDEIPWIPIIGAGIFFYFITREQEPQRAPGAPGSAPPVPAPRPTPVPLAPNRYNQQPPSEALLDRLRESAAARHIFAIQSLGYSARMTDDPPTGVTNAALTRIVDGARLYMSVNLGTDQASLRRFSTMLRLQVRNPRLQPMWLPNDIHAEINRYIGYDPSVAASEALMPLQTYGP